MNPISTHRLKDSFIGRKEILEQLHSYKEYILDRRGAIVFLSHEAGIGKTTLVEHFLQEVRQDSSEIAIFKTRCMDITLSRQPFEPFSRLLHLMAETKGTPYKEIIMRLSPKILEGLPWVGPALGETIKIVTEKKREAGNVLSIGSVSVIWQYVNLLRKLAEAQPMILFIDDLQWMDSSSCNLLFDLARNISEIPVLLIGNYRSDEIEGTGLLPKRPFKDILFELRRYRYGSIKIIELELFTANEVELFLNETFNPNDFPSEFAKQLINQTEGNPFYLYEILAFLYETGYITQIEGIYKISDIPTLIPIPDSVESAIMRRFDSLDEEQKKVLRYASVQGQQFRVSVLAHMLRMERLNVIEILSEICTKYHLVVDTNSFDRRQQDPDWAFYHVLVQRTIYETLTASQALELHRVTAEYLETSYIDDVNLLAWELARHFAGGRVWQKSAYYGYLATRLSYQAQSYQEAIDTSQDALSNLKKTPLPNIGLQADLHWLQSRCLVLLNRYQEAETQASTGLYIATQLNDPKRMVGALTRLAEIYMRTRQIENLRKVYSTAWKIAVDQQDVHMQVYIAQFYIRDISNLLPDLAESFTQHALEHAQRLSKDNVITLALYSRGIHFYYNSKYEQAADLFLSAVDRLNKMDPGTLNDLVIVDIPVVPNIRYRGILENSLEFLAWIRRESGDWRLAIDNLWTVYNSKVRYGDKPGECGLQSVVSETYLMAGEYDKALELHELAFNMAMSLESQHLQALILQVGMQVAADIGDIDLLTRKLKAFKETQGTGEDYWIKSTYLEYSGILEYIKGVSDQAEFLFNALLELADQYQDTYTRVRANYNLAKCAFNARDYPRATKFLDEALYEFGSGKPHQKGELIILKARISNAIGDIKSSLSYLDQARKLYTYCDFTRRIEAVQDIAMGWSY